MKKQGKLDPNNPYDERNSAWYQHREALRKRALMFEAQREAARLDAEARLERERRYMPRTGRVVSPMEHLLEETKEENPGLLERLIAMFRKPEPEPEWVERCPGHPDYGYKRRGT